MSRRSCLLLLSLLGTSAGAAELQGIAITPDDPVVPTGAIQRFVATGSFTDATTGRLSNATLAAGGNHTCAIVRNGSVRCWGQDGAGQLGDGGTTELFIGMPVPVAGISNATSLAGGFQHACAVQADGGARCWGRGTEGQLDALFRGCFGRPVGPSGLVQP
jgi:hypothetical protein